MRDLKSRPSEERPVSAVTISTRDDLVVASVDGVEGTSPDLATAILNLRDALRAARPDLSDEEVDAATTAPERLVLTTLSGARHLIERHDDGVTTVRRVPPGVGIDDPVVVDRLDAHPLEVLDVLVLALGQPLLLVLRFTDRDGNERVNTRPTNELVAIESA